MYPLIDVHCHISPMPTGVVGAFICNSVTQSDWNLILDLAKTDNRVFPALGMHPWYVGQLRDGWDNDLYRLLVAHPNAMVGECGLDKLHPDYQLQLTVFRRHIEIANALHRSVHVHCVRAWDDMFNILRQCGAELPAVVLHGFTGNANQVMQFLKIPNIYFSIGRAIMDAHRTGIRNALRTIPTDRILIETDGAFMESENILSQVAQTVTKIIDIDLSQIYNNTQRVLQNGQITQN